MPLGMQKILLAVVLGISLIFLGTICNKSSSPTNTTPVSISSVKIKNFSFNPQSITVSRGTVVTWTNEDSADHQIESDGNLPDLLSGVLIAGNSYSFTFNQAGAWKYHCKIHPTMTGEVIVK